MENRYGINSIPMDDVKKQGREDIKTARQDLDVNFPIALEPKVCLKDLKLVTVFSSKKVPLLV